MKVIKAKYYKDTEEIIPLNPQPIRVKGDYTYERNGTDEKGEYTIIDFMSSGDIYFGYDPEQQTSKEPLEVIITEEEWTQPAEKSIESRDTTMYSDVLDAVEPISLKLVTTSTETNKQISLTVIEKLIQNIKRFCFNVLTAIRSLFQP